jgi:hypothetical protein
MRADVVLAGVDARTGGNRYVVVELKQWSQAELYKDAKHLVLVPGVYRALSVGYVLLRSDRRCPSISERSRLPTDAIECAPSNRRLSGDR